MLGAKNNARPLRYLGNQGDCPSWKGWVGKTEPPKTTEKEGSKPQRRTQSAGVRGGQREKLYD